MKSSCLGKFHRIPNRRISMFVEATGCPMTLKKHNVSKNSGSWKLDESIQRLFEFKSGRNRAYRGKERTQIDGDTWLA